jgi:hypothetical protein
VAVIGGGWQRLAAFGARLIRLLRPCTAQLGSPPTRLPTSEAHLPFPLLPCACQVPGNVLRSPLLQGRLRLATRSLFFEPDDTRVPIARIPLAAVRALTSGPAVATLAAAAAPSPTPPHAARGGGGAHSLMVAAQEVVLMRADMQVGLGGNL